MNKPYLRLFLALSSILSGFTALNAQVISYINLPGGIKADVAEDVAADAEGNSYVTGKFSVTMDIGDTTLVSAGKEDIFVAKFDPSGNLVWARRAGGPQEDQGIEIGVDSVGAVYAAGRYEGTVTFDSDTVIGSGNNDIFVVKYDRNGNLKWVNGLGGSRDDRCRGLSVDPGGYCYIGGRYRVSTKLNSIILTAIEEEDVFVAKLDTSGPVLWANTFGGIRKDFGEDVISDQQGNVYITGSYFQFIIFPDTTYYTLGDEEIFLAKYDTDGNYLWSRTMGSDVRDYGEALAVDEYGNILVSGAFSGTGYFGNDTLYSQGEMDMFLIKVNPDGDVLWSFSAGAPINNDVAWACAYDGRGNTLLSGWYRGLFTFGDTVIFGSNTYNIFAGKVNGAGKASWVTKLGNTNSEDIGRGVAADGMGNVYVAGGYEGTATYGTVTTTSNGNYDIIHAKLTAGADDCAISHAYAGVPTDCALSEGDSTYEISLTLYHYFPPSTGQLNVNGQLFPIGGNQQIVELDSLQAVSGFQDLHAFFTDNPACSLKVSNFFLTPASCDPCRITDVVVDEIGTCKIASNRFNAKVTVSYNSQPLTGLLVVNDQEFPITGSPQQVTLLNLYSDGQPVTISAYFTEDPFCVIEADSVFTAPAACSSCRVSGAIVNTVGGCNPVDGSYEVELGLGFRAWPPTGGVIVNGQEFAITTPPMTITLEGLPADGLPVDLQVTFEGDTLCGDTLSALFTAPPPCDTCAMVGFTFGNFGRCNPVDLTYSAEVSLVYANEPDSGQLNIDGQLFAITGSPQIILLEDLPIDGLPVGLSAFFTGSPTCQLSDTTIFTAPDTCQDCLMTDIALADLLDNCNPLTNKYEVELQVEYLNPPVGGNLFVGGQAFPITGSPQTVLLNNLTADGLLEDIPAFFANDIICAYTANDLYTAPDPCDTCAVPVNLRHTLDTVLVSQALVEWDAVPYATGYELRGRRMPSGAYGYTFPNSNGRLVKNLKPGKTYGWQVKSRCPFDTSEWSAEQYFTLYSARLAGVEGTLAGKLSLFPNPSTGPGFVLVEASTSEPVLLRAMDINGAVLNQWSHPGTTGKTAIPLDLSAYEPGIYLIEVRQGAQSGVLRLVLSR